MRIVCWQTILMNYHALFFSKNWDGCRKICRLLRLWSAFNGFDPKMYLLIIIYT